MVVSSSICHEIYFSFKAYMCTQSISHMERKFCELVSLKHCSKHSKLHKYVFICPVFGLTEVSGHHVFSWVFLLGVVTQFVEVVFKVVTDCTLDHVLMYIVTQLRGIIPLTSDSNLSNHMIMTYANNFRDKFTKKCSRHTKI